MANAPGRPHRDVLSLTKLFKWFPDDATARNWIESIVWPDGPHCLHCRSLNVSAASSTTHDTPLPGLRGEAAIQRQDRDRHAIVQAGLFDMDHCRLSGDDLA